MQLESLRVRKGATALARNGIAQGSLGLLVAIVVGVVVVRWGGDTESKM